MAKYFSTAIIVFLLFLGVDCKDDKPCLTCPQPIDTTSHNWVFDKPVFLGDGSSSALYDIAIINDSLAYAVGEIYKKDSTGNWDPDAYNAVRWDGKKLELLRIPFIGSCSAVKYPPLKTIWAFSSTEIIVSNGGSIVTYNSGIATMDCRMNSLLMGAITKIFASSPQDVYLVGGAGAIVHYNGSIWMKIESGTNLPFLDIYGATDSKTGEQQILALCSQNLPHERGLYQIKGNTATKISTYPLQYDLTSIWFVPNKHYYLVGAGMFEKKFLSDSSWRGGEPGVVKYVLGKVRGNGLNDVFAVGAYGEVLHYNGVSWQSYIDQTGIVNGGYGSMAVKGNLVIAVGVANSPLAAVTIGRRK